MKTDHTPVIQNRSARYHYQVLDTFEVGVVLKGTEVKSIRAAKIVLSEAYVVVRNHEIFLMNAYVDEYAQGNIFNHLPRRERKLLAHRHEIQKMEDATTLKGLTIIPLKAYFKGSVFKMEIGICKGKDARDKRQD